MQNECCVKANKKNARLTTITGRKLHAQSDRLHNKIILATAVATITTITVGA